jgi:hypothetical protein
MLSSPTFFFFFSLFYVVSMACGPRLSINTPQSSSSPNHIAATWARNAESVVVVHANKQPDARLRWGYKTKSQAPLLPNRSRWLPRPPLAAPRMRPAATSLSTRGGRRTCAAALTGAEECGHDESCRSVHSPSASIAQQSDASPPSLGYK